MTARDDLIEVDSTTAQLIGFLVDLLAKEPPQDAGHHPSMELHERVGAAWAEWDKQVHGLRTVIGARLTNRAIEQLTPTSRGTSS